MSKAEFLPEQKPGRFEVMPEGLDGYWWETEQMVCVPLVIATMPHRFSAFLKAIEAKGKTVFFPTVVSGHLDAILRGRGYTEACVDDAEMGCVDGLALIRSEVAR